MQVRVQKSVNDPFPRLVRPTQQQHAVQLRRNANVRVKAHLLYVYTLCYRNVR